MAELHPLKQWQVAQDPPWSTKYLAMRLGCQHGWLSTILNANFKKRGGAEVAYAVEVLTKKKVTVLDMLLTPKERAEIRHRVNKREN